MRDIVRDRALSAVEKMADRHAPIGSYLPKSPSMRAVTDLSIAIEKRLAKSGN